MKTNEEIMQHSQALEVDETLYGKSPVTNYEIDLAFKDNGKDDSWKEGTDFFEAQLVGWHGHSAGTGFGLRDMQFSRHEPMTEEEFKKLILEARAAGIALVYMNQYGVNEWGEQVDEDTPHNHNFGR
jgi:hypothetical protein